MNTKSTCSSKTCSCHTEFKIENKYLSKINFLSSIEKKDSIEIILSFILLITAFFIENNILKLLVYLLTYVIIGRDVLIEASKNILKGDFLDENFLMSIAKIGAFILKEYPEAI